MRRKVIQRCKLFLLVCGMIIGWYFVRSTRTLDDNHLVPIREKEFYNLTEEGNHIAWNTSMMLNNCNLRKSHSYSNFTLKLVTKCLLNQRRLCKYVPVATRPSVCFGFDSTPVFDRTATATYSPRFGLSWYKRSIGRPSNGRLAVASKHGISLFFILF